MTTRETEWLVWLATRDHFPGLPRLLMVCTEVQCHSSYKLLGARWPCKPHHMFKITLSGSGMFRDAAGTRRVGPGFGFLCGVADPAMSYWYPPRAAEPWRFIYLAFEGADDLVRALVSRHGPVLPAPEGIVRRLQRFRHGREATAIVNAMEGAKCVYDVLTAAGEAAEQRDDARFTVSGRMRRLRDLIRAEARNIPTIGTLARREGVSREHLSRLFQRHAGLPLREFLGRARMDEACADLRETTLEVKEIAARFGYSSQSHFTRAFVKMTGMTPRRFRESGATPLGARNIPGDARGALGPNVAVP